MESKKNEDGFDYLLDANGNVQKDSLGNDIKVIRYKTITCNVKEMHLFKTARISGAIDYRDNSNNKILKSESITSDTKFEHHYAIVNGNLNALKSATRKKIRVNPLPFPADESLVYKLGKY